MIRSVPSFITLLLATLAFTARAQDDMQPRGDWSSRSQPPPVEVHAFHSLHGALLPTAETMQAGDFEFQLMHRFVPTVSDGAPAMWGFDGPAHIRLALSWAYADAGFLSIARSDVDDNLELSARQRILATDNLGVPVIVAAQGGAAWNTQFPGLEASDTRAFQYFGQVTASTLLWNTLGVGIVPAYLYNSAPRSEEIEYSLLLGLHGQVYINRNWSVLAEWNPLLAGYRNGHNVASFAVELETGGHFFKIVLSNSDLMNTTQYLAGSPQSFGDGDLHLGFNLTRLFSL